MAQDTVKARIRLKNDTEAHWRQATGFIPLKGEIIIYSADDSHPFSRLKVGDGITYVNDLPFLRADDIREKVRIDTSDFWNRQTTFIPELGEIIIYADQELSYKIGDGTTYLADLPSFGHATPETTAIEFYESAASFPTTGSQNLLYFDKTNLALYAYNQTYKLINKYHEPNTWIDINTVSGITQGTTDAAQIGATGISYRIENENHIYIYINVANIASQTTINASPISSELRPNGTIYATGIGNNDSIIQACVTQTGYINITSISTNVPITWTCIQLDYFI